MNARLAILLGLSLVAAPAAAQHYDDDPISPREATPWYLGGNLTYARPQGAFSNFVDQGFGGSGHAILRLDRDGIVGLRMDVGALNYGSETMRVPLSSTIGGRVLVDMQTSNNIAFVGVGPQLGVPTGRLRPYVHGFAGVQYLFTQTSVEGTASDEPFASSTNYDDATFAWGGGGGLYIPVRRGPSPISVDLGVRYHNGGNATYLREGDIEDLPNNQIGLNLRQSDTDLVTFHVGVTVGLSR